MTDSSDPKTKEIEDLSRLLELELIQKRATWQQAGQRYRSYRAAGFAFLALLVVACVIGGYFVFMRVSEQRANPPPSSSVGR
jgi:hypothetical protein